MLMNQFILNTVSSNKHTQSKSIYKLADQNVMLMGLLRVPLPRVPPVRRLHRAARGGVPHPDDPRGDRRAGLGPATRRGAVRRRARRARRERGAHLRADGRPVSARHPGAAAGAAHHAADDRPRPRRRRDRRRGRGPRALRARQVAHGRGPEPRRGGPRPARRHRTRSGVRRPDVLESPP